MIWLDIDNPPQVQYLLPFKFLFEERGFEVIVTARDYGITKDLLNERNIKYYSFSKEFGKARIRKIFGVVLRALRLIIFLRQMKISFVISSSRSSAIAAKLMHIPCYIICDYEFADLKIYRLFDCNIVYPEYINISFFLEHGFQKKN